MLRKDAIAKTGEGIKSGMLISLDEDGLWVKGLEAGAIPHFALQDQSDEDVVAGGGKLTGLSCLGKTRIRTAYVDSEASYVDGSPLKEGAEAGEVTLGALDSTDTILGFVAGEGLEDVAPYDSSATPDDAGKIWSINLDTMYVPNRRAP